MKIEDQVCSLELAKRLKKLGVPQDSLFWWVRMEDSEPRLHLLIRETLYDCENGYDMHETMDDGDVSAFTVGELGEMLPPWIEDAFLEISKHGEVEWGIQYCEDDAYILHSETAPNEADARAKMLIYLLENKLV